jgi:glycosyltransferase involved in cell wall biosynthesis
MINCQIPVAAAAEYDLPRMAAPSSNAIPTLSVVIPVLNESANIAPLLARLQSPLAAIDPAYEIIFVGNGSLDDTAARVQRMTAEDPRVRLLRLSRNFGHQAALVAGLEHARGAAVVTMDGDLQHPPEVIPALVTQWRAGHEVVQAVRRQPADVNHVKRAGSHAFYRALSALTRLDVTPGAADFRLMSRAAVDAFLACRERCRCNRALVQWIGFSYTEVPYDAEPRFAGRTKYSYGTLFRLAADAIFSFSTWPLRFAGLVGGIVSLAAAGYLVFILWARLFADRVPPGWSSILATVLILGGVNLMVLWILGEYVGRLYEEVKQRPLYIVRPPPPHPTASIHPNQH